MPPTRPGITPKPTSPTWRSATLLILSITGAVSAWHGPWGACTRAAWCPRSSRAAPWPRSAAARPSAPARTCALAAFRSSDSPAFVVPALPDGDRTLVQVFRPVLTLDRLPWRAPGVGSVVPVPGNGVRPRDGQTRHHHGCDDPHAQ